MNSIDNLLLHAGTKEKIYNFIDKPSHALLITGTIGSGKPTVAKAIAKELLQISKELESYPYYFHLIKPENKQDISIDAIRKLIAEMQLKAPGSHSIRKVVFIEDAHYLSIPAQNALLKILEEPSLDTVFILSTPSSRSVLPTISSRAQQLNIQPITLSESQQFWGKKHPTETIESAWRLSQGAAGLLSALLNTDQKHQLKAALEEVKLFLGANSYRRLLILDKLTRNKEQFTAFLDAMARSLQALHHIALNNGKLGQAEKLLQSRRLTSQVQDALNGNASVKLSALHLVVNLKI